MKAILVCPADRAPVAFLARTRPLALVPFHGRTLLDLWLADLASRGARHVVILAADRPDRIRAAVGRGEAWGLTVEVLPEKSESTAEEARQRHRSDGAPGLPAPHDVVVLDRLPGGSEDLWTGCAGWLAALAASRHAAATQRIGMRELQPGVFAHVRAHVAGSARLRPPCWIGANAWIGDRAIVGPDTVVEEESYLDDGTEVVHSFVGPGTYVGALTEVRDSLAWGRGLYRWTNGSFVEVVDDFLLSDLDHRARRRGATHLPGRLAALAALVLTSPILLWAWLRRRPGQPYLVRHQAVRAPVGDPAFADTVARFELAPLAGLGRRWPELWNILRGEFAWVGNRPLAPSEAATLHNEFERLWLATPSGLVSLADAEGSAEPFGDEARVHASFYSVRRDWRGDLRILLRVFARATGRPSPNVDLPCEAP